MKNVIITTTNHIENSSIKNYLGVISTNIVIGTNFFSDFAASITDIFGGNSSSYQRKLENIYHQAMDSLSDKAASIKANAVIGLHIDFDEVSGKGKSMFMVSVIGTAVVIEYDKTAIEYKTQDDKSLSEDGLILRYRVQQIFEKVREGKLPNEEEWKLLQNKFIVDVAEKLLIPYLEYSDNEVYDNKVYVNELRFYYPKYIEMADRNTVISILYPHCEKYKTTMIKLFTAIHLFPYELIEQYIANKQIHEACQFILINMYNYSNSDLLSLKHIESLFDNLPNIGRIEKVTVKGLLSSKETEKYICPNGHKNPKENLFCSTCCLDIKGMNSIDQRNLKEFKEKIRILEEYFK